MRKILAVAALLIAFSLSSFAQGTPEQQVKKVFDDQIAAWNHGDLDAFMNGYWHSPDLTFFGNGSETRGWQATLDRYRKSYKEEGHQMGKLDFKSMQITPLGSDYALARGVWHLVMPDGKERSGMTSLVLRHFPDGWKIIHDHSSAEQK